MYKVIDIIETGKNIKKKISDSGLTVTEIQIALELSAPQSIYRWFRGETLPSIDNLYTMDKQRCFKHYEKRTLLWRCTCKKNLYSKL